MHRRNKIIPYKFGRVFDEASGSSTHEQLLLGRGHAKRPMPVPMLTRQRSSPCSW